MTTLLHPEYHTISRRLYPTTEQKLQLAAQFDLQDRAFNEWADLANNGVLQGKSYETIQREIEAHLIPTDRREDRYALGIVRSHVLALLVRLTAGKIEKIRPRLPDRRQRSFTYETVGISEYHLALPSLGTIAMTHSSPLPPNETLCYAKVFVDDFGDSYHVDLVTVSTVPDEAPYPVPDSDCWPDLWVPDKLRRRSLAAKRFRVVCRRRHKQQNMAKSAYHMAI